MRLLPGAHVAEILAPGAIDERVRTRIAKNSELLEVHEGPHSVDGNFTVGPREVVVLGDLVVRGAVLDTHEADHTLLIVVGSLSASAIATLAEIVITQDVTADVVYGNSLFDETLTIGGNLTALAVINDGHHFDVKGEWRVRYQIAAHNSATLPSRNFDTDTLSQVLIENVLESSQSISLPKMYRALRSGEKVIRTASSPQER